MAHSVVARQRVQVGTQIGIVEVVIVGQEMRSGVDFGVDGADRRARGINLGAVAGRQDRRFAAGGRCGVAAEPGARSRDRMRQLIRRKRELLTQRDRGGGMVEADGEQVHRGRLTSVGR